MNPPEIKMTRPTDVSVVLEYLVKLDDFANKAMILEATSLPYDRLRPALAHLMKHHAIDCVIVNKNELWFFATPADDDRVRVLPESHNGIKRTEKGRRYKGRSDLLGGINVGDKPNIKTRTRG